MRRGIHTCLQNKPKEVVLLFCFRPPYIRSPAYPSQSGAGGRPMFSSQHPNYGNSQAPMMHQPDQYGQVATYPDLLRDLGIFFFKPLMTVPSGCERNTQNEKAKDPRGNPSQRGLSFCFFLFVSGFLFVLFCFVFHSYERFRGSVVEPCMPSPRSCLCMAFGMASFPSCLRGKCKLLAPSE